MPTSAILSLAAVAIVIIIVLGILYAMGLLDGVIDAITAAFEGDE